MILPSKHLSGDRALITVGGHILVRLDRPKTISALWEEMRHSADSADTSSARLSYDWFILALNLLYAIDAIALNEGILSRTLP